MNPKINNNNKEKNNKIILIINRCIGLFLQNAQNNIKKLKKNKIK